MAEHQPVVVVTGGTRGLGLHLTEAFSARGAVVVSCGRTPPELVSTASFLPCDVRDPQAVAALIARIVEQFGRIDVLVNNAGGSPSVPADTMSPRLFERVVALNLVAPFLVAQQANAVMQNQDHGGVIINIGSVAARRPCPGTAAYNAAKAGLAVLTQSLALEWAPKVRVNTVTVGLLRTDSVGATYGADLDSVAATIPMGRLVEPQEVAEACIWLASSAAASVTGSELTLDGGGQVPAFYSAVVPVGPGADHPRRG